ERGALFRRVGAGDEVGGAGGGDGDDGTVGTGVVGAGPCGVRAGCRECVDGVVQCLLPVGGDREEFAPVVGGLLQGDVGVGAAEAEAADAGVAAAGGGPRAAFGDDPELVALEVDARVGF